MRTLQLPTHLQQSKPLDASWWQEAHKPPAAPAESCNTHRGGRGQCSHFILMKNFPVRVS